MTFVCILAASLSLNWNILKMSEVSGISEEISIMEIYPTISSEENIDEESSLNSDLIDSISNPKIVHLSLAEDLNPFLIYGGVKKEYINLLQTFFGQVLIERIISSDFYRQLPDELNNEHCYQLLGSMGHHLTYDDLENFFVEIKSGDIKTKILTYSHIPFLGKMATSVMYLPNYWINHLIELFRNPLQAIESTYPTPLGADLETVALDSHPDLSYTYYDYAIKKLIKESNHSNPEFYLSYRELLAKLIGYANPSSIKEGMIIPIFHEKTGQLNYYQLENQIHFHGLHGYLLTPKKRDSELPAIFTFCGTDEPASHHRDLDPKGIGKQVFDICSKEILQMLKTYTSCFKNPKLELIGHSLGAADCQRTLVDLIASPYSKIFEEISLFSYCSPKLDISTIQKWHKNLSQLKNEEKKPLIYLSFAYHEKDIITWTGDSNLIGVKDFITKQSYFIVKSESGISEVRLHHTSPFFRFGNFDFDTDHRTFHLIQSYSEKDLDTWIKKLKEVEKSFSWYLKLKSYFFKVETAEQIREKINQIKQEQARFEDFNQKSAEQSWWMWSASRAFNYTLQPILYHVYGWIIGEGSKKNLPKQPSE